MTVFGLVGSAGGVGLDEMGQGYERERMGSEGLGVEAYHNASSLVFDLDDDQRSIPCTDTDEHSFDSASHFTSIIKSNDTML